MMLQVSDVRQTRVFQEALEEGLQKGREEQTIAIASALLEMGHPADKIAKATGLAVSQVRKLKKKKPGGRKKRSLLGAA